jgi:hypothetical protein
VAFEEVIKAERISVTVNGVIADQVVVAERCSITVGGADKVA